jgi:microcin C transport system permease protein
MKPTPTAKRNPVASQRWQRFRGHRRAFVSACLLLALFLLTLSANLLCNDRPIYLSYNGKHYFPAFQNLPEDLFIPGGRQTAPDYKSLAKTEAFAPSSGNSIRFPPIPYGPSHVADAARIRALSGIPVSLTPIPLVGSINVDTNLHIVRATAAGPFFMTDDTSVPNTQLEQHWVLPTDLRQAMAARFANQHAEAISANIQSAHTPPISATLSIPAYRPRRAPPRSVRITLRDANPQATTPIALTFTTQGEIHQPPHKAWHALSLEDRTRISSAAANPNTDPASSFQVASLSQTFTVRVAAGVTWPHPPVGDHWLGIDEAGRDVLARIVYGLRVSLLFAICLVLVSYATGILVGAVQGFFGGAVDLIGQRLIEIWATLPFLYVMMLIGSIFGRGFGILLFCYAIFNWIGISYYVRAEFLKLRNQPFVDAARVMGLSNTRIMLRHILPNAMTPVITLAPIALVGAISSLAALDYLGFGLPALTPSIGQLLQQAQIHQWAWWLILYPSLALFIILLLSVFVGEGVRKAYDPRPPFNLE